MRFDAQRAAVFTELFSEAHRTALNLQSSLTRLSPIFPLSVEAIEAASEEEKDRLDAFRVRFADLQDVIGRKLFRSLLILEEEEPGTMLDTLNQLTKRRIIDSFDTWARLRDTRNLLTHDYPRASRERAEALNAAYEQAPVLLACLRRLRRYAEETIGMDLSEFAAL